MVGAEKEEVVDSALVVVEEVVEVISPLIEIGINCFFLYHEGDCLLKNSMLFSKR